MQTLNKMFAFVKKDCFEAMSYKLSFGMQLVSIFLSLAVFFFLSRIFGSAMMPEIQKYGGDFFSFVLIGLSFTGYMTLGLNNFAESIREAQIKGTLEALLVTPTNISTIIFASSIWVFLFATLRVLLFLLIGVFIFGVKLTGANYLGAMLILILTIIVFCSLGIISASFVMVFKKGNPITWIFGSASTLLGGIYFPISVLPSWVQNISYLLPITHSLEAMRLLLLQHYPLSAVLNELQVLILFCIIFLPLSIGAFKFALNRAKIEGSLIQF
jgi:ABC-2 type transport system permease protein